MKIAHILPTKCLDMIASDKYHMMLPHLLVQDDDYADFYMKVEGHKILDNGIAESVDFDWHDLVSLGTAYEATQIVVPDVMGNADLTMQAANAFRPIARRNDQFEYIGVVQAKSVHDLARMMAFYIMSDYITKISFPRILNNTMGVGTRKQALVAYEEQIRDYLGEGSVHCLGGSAEMREVEDLKEFSHIVQGMDSSVCGVMGLEKRKIDQDSYVGRQAGYFEAEPSSAQLQCIRHNIDTMNRWAR